MIIDVNSDKSDNADDKQIHFDLENDKIKISITRCSGLPLVMVKVANLETNSCGDLLSENEKLLQTIFGGEHVLLTIEQARSIGKALLENADDCEKHPKSLFFQKLNKKHKKID